VMESITAQGISNALRDADRLTDAVVAGLGGAQPLDEALARHHRQRDEAVTPMFDFTVGQTRFRPVDWAQRTLFSALAERPAEFSRFLGAFAGITPIQRYLSLSNVARVLICPRERPQLTVGPRP